MAFVWCPQCKKHLVPKGIQACSSCSSFDAWQVPRDHRQDMDKGDRLLLISVVIAAALTAIIVGAYSL